MLGSEWTKLGKDFPVPQYLLYTEDGKKTEYGQLDNAGWSYLHNYNVAHNVGMVTVRFPNLLNREHKSLSTVPFVEQVLDAQEFIINFYQKHLTKKVGFPEFVNAVCDVNKYWTMVNDLCLGKTIITETARKILNNDLWYASIIWRQNVRGKVFYNRFTKDYEKGHFVK